MGGHALSGLASSDQFVVYETKYWQVNRNSSPFPHCSGPFLNSDSPLAMQRPD
jgi:hypothetical protein